MPLEPWTLTVTGKFPETNIAYPYGTKGLAHAVNHAITPVLTAGKLSPSAIVYTDEGTADDTGVTVDLNNASLTEGSTGDAFSFLALSGVLIANTGEYDLIFGGSASDPWFPGPTDGEVTIAPGGVFMVTSDFAGWTVDSSNHIIRMRAESGQSTGYKAVLWGRK